MALRNRNSATRLYLKLILNQILVLLFAGVVVGAIAGYFGMWTATGEKAVATNSANLFPLLGLVLPAVLLWLTWLALRGKNARQFYASSASAIGILLSVSLLGGTAGCICFFVSATNIPAMFAKLDPIALSQDLQTAVGLEKFLGLVAFTTVAGLAQLLLVNRSKRSSNS